MACSEPRCKVSKNLTVLQKKIIRCESPFCTKSFHINCTGLKIKSENELDKIYFVCKKCITFFEYINTPIREKISDIEQQISTLNTHVTQKIAHLEKVVNNLSTKIEICENKMNGENKEISIRVQKLEELHNNHNFSENINKIEAESRSRTSELHGISKKLSTKVDTLEQILQEQASHYAKKGNQSPKTDNCSPPSLPNTKGNKYKQQIKIHGIIEPHGTKSRLERYDLNKVAVEKIFKALNVNEYAIEDIFPLGKYDEHKNCALIVTFSSVWDKRKVLANAYLLKNSPTPTFINAVLSPKDQEIEKKVLQKRWQMIQNGTASRQEIKIKDLKLYVHNKEVLID